uniref:ArfGAP with FG repeats 2 n=1 Tax=Ornithorhynchus anatinus TaxID=9258 RepID=A0A6I8P324_ORNAN
MTPSSHRPGPGPRRLRQLRRLRRLRRSPGLRGPPARARPFPGSACACSQPDHHGQLQFWQQPSDAIRGLSPHPREPAQRPLGHGRHPGKRQVSEGSGGCPKSQAAQLLFSPAHPFPRPSLSPWVRRSGDSLSIAVSRSAFAPHFLEWSFSPCPTLGPVSASSPGLDSLPLSPRLYAPRSGSLPQPPGLWIGGDISRRLSLASVFGAVAHVPAYHAPAAPGAGGSGGLAYGAFTNPFTAPAAHPPLPSTNPFQPNGLVSGPSGFGLGTMAPGFPPAQPPGGFPVAFPASTMFSPQTQLSQQQQQLNGSSFGGLGAAKPGVKGPGQPTAISTNPFVTGTSPSPFASKPPTTNPFL